MSYTNLSHSLNDLFGTPNIKAVYDLPCHIGELAGRLNYSGFTYTASELIRNHTLFNLYEPFLPNELAEKTYARMLGCGSLGLHASLGLCSSTVPMLEYYKFCPECNAEFMKSHGGIYLHRVHQTPCIDVCPYHRIPLFNSSVTIENFDGRHISYNRSLVDLSKYDYSMLVRIAEAFEYIISGQLRCSYADLKLRYRSLLKEQNYLYGNTRLDTQKVMNDFINHYGEKLLMRFGATVEDVYCNWLLSAFRNTDRITHPVRHILIILFFCESVHDFSQHSPLSELKPEKRINAPKNDFAHHYKSILALIDKFPEKSRQALRSMDNAAYQWLNIHDKDWFERHMPPKRIPKPVPKRINWADKDSEVLAKVKKSVSQLLSERNPFVRVTIYAVCGRSGEQYRILNNRHKLPKTMKYLEAVAETSLQFQYRKIRCVISDTNEELTKELIYKNACIVKYRFREVDDYIESLFSGVQINVGKNSGVQSSRICDNLLGWRLRQKKQ